MLRSLFLVGDSTVRSGEGNGANGQLGWGEPLVQLFDREKINVVNRALGGRSSRTYITEGHWAATLAMVKPGDVVLIQFGHNDEAPVDGSKGGRGSLPGVGDDVQEVVDAETHRRDLIHSYGWYLREYAIEAIAHGAVPILCSPVPRNEWREGRTQQSTERYAGWAHAIAVQQRVLFLDLNRIIAERYDALGQSATALLFTNGESHTTVRGATLNAELVVSGLKGLRPDPLAGFFSKTGEAIAAVAIQQYAPDASPLPASAR